MANQFNYEGVSVEWLGHDGFKISDGKVIIYIDPYNLRSGLSNDADIILITHEHFDHCNLDSIELVRKNNTLIIGTAGCISKIPYNIKVLNPGSLISFDGIKIKAFPAYNTNKFRSPGIPYHPSMLGNGYIININGKNIYHAGDTDNITEMSDLASEQIDIALLPISGIYVMNLKEAANAVKQIKPKIVIPMHYGSGVVGSEIDPYKFKELVGNDARVEILNQ